MNTPSLAPYLEEYARSASAAVPPWLAERKRSGIEVFSARGFPTLRDEDWKYTDVGAIARRRFRTADPSLNGIGRDSVDALRLGDLDRHEMVFVHGRRAVNLAGAMQASGGLDLRSLRESVADGGAALEQHLARSADAAKNPFVALNTALFNDGAFLSVGDGAVIEAPIHLMFLGGNSREAVASYPRNLIILGRNARATVIETYSGINDAPYLTCAVTEIVLGPGATLEHYKIQQEGGQGLHVGALAVVQDRDSRLESHSISLGGALSRGDIHTRLAAPGAEASLNGLYVAGGRQHVDHHTRIDHEMPRTRSDENFRGVLDGRSRGVFNGKVVVHKDAQKSDARQSNANLLLSDDAEVDTKPELEIYADDVKCSHGATVGRLDQGMLFYLRTRAIPAATARSLLTFAFAEDVISRIRLSAIRSRLENSVSGRLPDAALIREFMQ